MLENIIMKKNNARIVQNHSGHHRAVPLVGGDIRQVVHPGVGALLQVPGAGVIPQAAGKIAKISLFKWKSGKSSLLLPLFSYPSKMYYIPV